MTIQQWSSYECYFHLALIPIFDTEAQLQLALFPRAGMKMVPCRPVTAGHLLPLRSYNSFPIR
jgi:hypothetical protein